MSNQPKNTSAPVPFTFPAGSAGSEHKALAVKPYIDSEDPPVLSFELYDRHRQPEEIVGLFVQANADTDEPRDFVITEVSTKRCGDHQPKPYIVTAKQITSTPGRNYFAIFNGPL